MDFSRSSGVARPSDVEDTRTHPEGHHRVATSTKGPATTKKADERDAGGRADDDIRHRTDQGEQSHPRSSKVLRYNQETEQ